MSTVVHVLRLVIINGASFSETITWTSNGVLVPLPVGTIAEAKVRESVEATAVLFRFSTAPGATDGLITLSDPGVTTLSITPAKTALLTPILDAVFDIKYTFASGTVITKLTDGKGRVDILPVVTRP